MNFLLDMGIMAPQGLKKGSKGATERDDVSLDTEGTLQGAADGGGGGNGGGGGSIAGKTEEESDKDSKPIDLFMPTIIRYEIFRSFVIVLYCGRLFLYIYIIMKPNASPYINLKIQHACLVMEFSII